MLAAMLASGGAVSGQPLLDTAGRWQILEHGFHSGFPTDREALGDIFFRNRDHGYLLHRFATDDGGATWREASGYIATPHRVVGRYGVAPSGHISSDSGRTWTQLPFASFDTVLRGSDGIASASGWGEKVVATFTFTRGYHDSVAGRSVYQTIDRLGITTDGGSTWKALDSIAVHPDPRRPRVSLLTINAFGSFPRPDSMPNAEVGWVKVLDMSDAATLWLLSYALDSVEGKTRSVFYLGKVDLVTGNAVWNQTELGRGLHPTLSDPEYFGMTFAHGFVFAYANLPNYMIDSVLYRSSNNGATWEKIALPHWLSLDGFHVFSPTHVVTANAISNDAGRTWLSWADPFRGSSLYTRLGNATIFHAVDSSRYALTLSNSFFATSGDAGHTWRRNHAWSAPLATAVHRGHIHLGWENRAVTSSRDGGITWRDAGGEPGELPAGVGSINALAFPNPDSSVNHIIGVARSVSYDDLSSMMIISSTDAGATWSSGVLLPALNESIGPYRSTPLAIDFYPKAGGGGRTGYLTGWGGILASDDGGRTWRTRLGAARIAMANADTGIGIRYLGFERKAAVLRTTDGWRTVRPVDTIASDAFLTVDYFGRGEYRILLRDGEMRSSDGGENWASTYTRPRLSQMGRFIRLDTARIYLLGSTAWYYSPDGGRSYQQILTHADPTQFNGAAAGFDDQYIYVGGYGNMIARWRLGGEPASGVEYRADGGAFQVSLANPVRGDDALLRYSLPHGAAVRAEVADMLGRSLRWEDAGWREGGEHHLRLDLSALASGRYLLRLRAGDQIRSVPLLLVR